MKADRHHLVLGGDLPVHRLGFGAMRLPTGDPAAAHALARRAVELGITFIDTADAYALGRNEELLAEALHPYPDDVVIATKAGQCHPGDEWIPLGRPEYLRQQAELSLRRLRVERIDLLQLHRIDPTVALADQIGSLRQLQDEGKVRHVGLSEVTVQQIVEAGRITPIASVQNRYNLRDRRSEGVLAHCEQHGIAFLPWLPIAPSVRSDSPVTEVAGRLGSTPARVVLAWLLRRSRVILPIPGTSSRDHLEENVGAVDLELPDEDFNRLDRLGRPTSEHEMSLA
ncbi:MULTISPECIES: aldo/keto reductase [Prauserella salsuginis group]|uniref:Aldo/keto reductase n=1 Tax=Prauserella salsuginis TaxID=387889 RepID=A0ABW6G8G7_9PSEU|nr:MULTISPECIES: aldo/keto reductase [Prauserella salsuginis group]MCR3722625.1 putative oxidoreductase [Prauserella flava]MCR3737067.1 putative oxidoreductase [Prauserella salsuginis]